MREGTDTGARDATRRICGRQRAAHIESDALLLSELTLGRGFVKLWVIELVHTVDVASNTEELESGVVLGGGLNVSGVLLLTVGGGLSNSLQDRVVIDDCADLSLDLLRL